MGIVILQEIDMSTASEKQGSNYEAQTLEVERFWGCHFVILRHLDLLLIVWLISVSPKNTDRLVSTCCVVEELRDIVYQ